MKVLASLKPYYYYLVGEGKKKIEVRKGEPKAKDWDRDVLFYMSKDEKSFAKIPKEFQEKYRKHFGKVGLEFVCDEIIEFWSDKGFYFPTGKLKFDTCLTNTEFYDYGKGKPLYGLHISNLKIYDKPKELGEFRKPCIDKYGYCQGCIHGLVTIPPDEEEYAFYHGGNYEFFDTHCMNYLTRPPQSWQYIEEN